MEHVNVLIIGAGVSGIGAACHLKMKSPDHTFTILEGRAAIGGTWDLFRYPGIRSDSDMYTFGYSFKPWAEDRDIATGESILRYLNETVDEYGLRDQIRFQHRVEKASWSSEDRRWTVTVTRDDGASFDISADFILTCTGYYDYDEGHLPEFDGYDDYEGTIAHPQHWPEDLDYAGKKVLIIGSGATAVTLVPSMASDAAHVTMLQRSPTYMFNRPWEDRIALTLKKYLPAPTAHALTRAKNIAFQRGSFYVAQRRPEKLRGFLRQMAVDALGPDFDVDTHFNPSYNPWDQRICMMPDGDFYDAIRSGSASVVTDVIDRFTKTGVKLLSGEEIEADIIVPATGLKLQFLAGIQVEVDGTALSPSELVTYRGVMFAGVPNAASVFGYTSASWTLKADLVSDYVCRLLNHMRKEGYDTVMPQADARAKPERSLMDNLKSGYVKRAERAMPKQAGDGPWVNNDDYFKDILSLKLSRFNDGVLRFTQSPKRRRFEFRGKTAVVTGAASGIGAALAEQLAERGSDLALVDINAAALEQVAAKARARGAEVSTHVVDLADSRAVRRFVDELETVHPRVELLINNAGIALGGSFLEASEAEFDSVLKVNLRGVVNLTRALLPRLLERPDAHVANVSSIFGMIAPPGNTAYCASKFAVRGFSESLRQELNGTSVGISVVHPGGIKTNIAKNARIATGAAAAGTQAEIEAARAEFEKNLITTPEKAASIILRGIEKRRARIMVGPDARFVEVLERVFPISNIAVLSWLRPLPKAASGERDRSKAPRLEAIDGGRSAAVAAE